MSEKTTSIFGAVISCMCCGVKLTAAAYLIDECQKCGRKKQERRRQLAGLRGAQEVGRRMAQEHDRRVFEILLGEDDG